MKLIARIFALSLVVTGAVASTQVHSQDSNTTKGAKMSMMPVPGCDPHDAGSCGMDTQ